MDVREEECSWGSLSRRVFLTLSIKEVEVREKRKNIYSLHFICSFFDHLDGLICTHSYVDVEQAYLNGIY